MEKNVAYKTLLDGFIKLCGEEHKEFLQDSSETILDLSITENLINIIPSILTDNSIDSEQLKLYNIDLEDFHPYFLAKEKVALLELEKYKKKHLPNVWHILYSDRIKDLNSVKAGFGYFKRFERDMGLTMYDEGGLDLHYFKKKNIDDARQSGKLFYTIEQIPNVFYKLGYFLAKQTLLEDVIKRVVERCDENTHHKIVSIFQKLIYELSISEDGGDYTIRKIQMQNPSVKIKTHKQIANSFDNLSQEQIDELNKLLK